MLGADVSHPGPGQTLPSFSAVVSSVDPKAARYVAANRVQEARVERIVDLADMIKAKILLPSRYKLIHSK